MPLKAAMTDFNTVGVDDSFGDLTLGVQYFFLYCGLNRIATLFLARGDEGLEVFFAQAFQMMIIAYIYLPLGILYSAAVVATFMRAATANFSTTVASTRLNTGKRLGQLLLWNIRNNGCEVISRLRICNAVKVSPDFKSLDYVGELRVLEPP